MSETTEGRYDRQFNRLNNISHELVKFVNDKDIQYGSSWRKRGGAGAFFVMARKWDRIEQACQKETSAYDIFNIFKEEVRQETILDDCLDLVGYLLILVEHIVELGYVTKIEGLKMSFDHPSIRVTGYDPDVKSATLVEPKPSGMKNPFGFEEEEEWIDARTEADAEFSESEGLE